jgi:peptidylprolyl isomerase
MRQLAAMIVLSLAAAVLAACGGIRVGPQTTPIPLYPHGNTNAQVSVLGAFEASPRISIPPYAPTGSLIVRTVIRGTGPIAPQSDYVLANMAVYDWTGSRHTLAATTFGGGFPQVISVRSVFPGAGYPLRDLRVGSRILAVLPTRYGQAVIGQVMPAPPATVVVLDIVAMFSPVTAKAVSDGGGRLPTARVTGSELTISTPKTTPPARAELAVLVPGSGPRVAAGDIVTAGLEYVLWPGRREFSWPADIAAYAADSGPDDQGQHELPGWRQLVGVPAGSRVLLVVPSAQVRGTAGTVGYNGSLLPHGSWVAYVLDILDVQSPGSVCAPVCNLGFR